jgi:hypothetical protein
MEREPVYNSKDNIDKVLILVIRIKNIIAKEKSPTKKSTRKRKNINNKGKTITSIFCY